MLAALTIGGTLVFGWLWLVTGPLFSSGPAPPRSVQVRDAIFLVAMLCCGLVVPWIGVVVAVAARQWRPAVIFTVLAVLLLFGGIRLQLVSHATLRYTWSTLVPTPSPTPTHTHCMEYSGGDNECPGG